MKVKLLKKIRKRFDIIHFPNGKVIDGEHYDYNIFQLVDNNDSGFNWHSDRYAQLGEKPGGKMWCEDIFNTEKECIDFLKERIVKYLRNEHSALGSKRKKLNNGIKVWYK
jgi:hypothetical protein